MKIHHFPLFATIFLSVCACTAMAAEGKDNCPVTTAPNPPFVPPAGRILVWHRCSLDSISGQECLAWFAPPR